MSMPVLSTHRGYLPDNTIKNIHTVTLFLNNTAFNLINKLAIDIKLSLANKIPLKLYIWGSSKLLIIY